MSKYETAERMYKLAARFEARRRANRGPVRECLLDWANPEERDEFEALRSMVAGGER